MLLIEKYEQEQTKDEPFIKKWMTLLANSQEDCVELWEMLIKDSQYVPLQMTNDPNLMNFSDFILSVLHNDKIVQCAPLFETFCIQALQNNPELLYNRYYLIYEGCPAYQIFSIFLIKGTIRDSFPLVINQYLEVPCFNILKFWIEQERSMVETVEFSYLNWSINGKVNLVSMRKKLETIDLVLGEFFTTFRIKNETFLRLKGFSEKEPACEERKKQLEMANQYLESWIEDINLEKFYSKIFHILSGYNNPAPDTINKVLSHLKTTPEGLQETYLMTAQNEYWEILKLIDSKYEEIYEIYPQIVFEILIKYITPEMFLTFVEKEFKLRFLFFSKEFVFKIFKKRNSMIAKLLLSDEEQRIKISKMIMNGQNILEFVCSSYGVTHKLIDILWSSGLFPFMPAIKNKKSREIIGLRFGMELEEEAIINKGEC